MRDIEAKPVATSGTSRSAGFRERAQILFPDLPQTAIDTFEHLLLQPAEALIARAEMSLNKPYGENYILSSGPRYGLAFVRMRPGCCCSLHFHNQRRELLQVRCGALTLTLGEERQVLKAGDIACTVPGQAHRIENLGDAPAEALELIYPFQLDDKIRIADAYRRPLGPVSHRE